MDIQCLRKGTASFRLTSIEIEGITEVLAEGYHCEVEKKFTDGLGKFVDQTKTMNVNEWNQMLIESLALSAEK